MSIRPAPATQHTPGAAVLNALRWVAVILGCGRRERARRLLALVLPRESHLEDRNTTPRS
ncbi:hypothetical protein [Paenarthrobacter sp. 2TAF44]|uniref:hypothetical protein n=1 Tax=Paenarthrobacter sp. 2TAF44 TaxID=3233018 RepID=UPI003F983B40